MKISVFNSETFERWTLRYILFSSFFIFFIILLLISNNYVGVITLCFFLGWYMVFAVSILEPINIEVSANFLRIKNKHYSWSSINWFVIEIYKDKQEIKNIVLIIDNKPNIYTVNDSKQNTRDFLVELETHVDMYDHYRQSGMQLFLRKIKL